MSAPGAFLLCLAGWAALALAMPRHHRQLFGREPRRPLPLRTLGALLLALALWISVAAGGGWGVGLVTWALLLTAAGVAFAFLLPFLSPASRRRDRGSRQPSR